MRARRRRRSPTKGRTSSRMLDPARLEDGQPPMRVGEVAAIIGYSVRYVQKLVDAEVVMAVRMPEGTERRVPVHEVRRLAHQLHVAVSTT